MSQRRRGGAEAPWLSASVKLKRLLTARKAQWIQLNHKTTSGNGLQCPPGGFNEADERPLELVKILGLPLRGGVRPPSAGAKSLTHGTRTGAPVLPRPACSGDVYSQPTTFCATLRGGAA